MTIAYREFPALGSKGGPAPPRGAGVVGPGTAGMSIWLQRLIFADAGAAPIRNSELETPIVV